MQRLKRYQAATMDDAYARVREECGGDAEIVSSRSVRSPGLFGAPPSEYVELVVRVSDEELERRAKLAARLAAARAEAAAARAAESSRPAMPQDAEDALAPPFVNDLAGSGVVPDHVMQPGLIERVQRADDRMDAAEELPAPASDPFAAFNAASAAAAFEPLRLDRFDDDTLAAEATPAAPAADRALLAGLSERLGEVHAMLRSLAADRLQQRIDGAPDAFAEVRARLLEQGVAPAVVATVLDQAAVAVSRANDPRATLRTVERKLAAQLPAVARVDFARRPVVLFLVGPAGAGKTTMAMRLALDIRAHALTSAVAGIDVNRAGAPQQLAALGSASGIPVTLCYAPGELQAMIAAAATDVIIVDTPGHTGMRRDRMTELQAFLQAARRRQMLLVLPATMKAADLAAVTKAYQALDPTGLVLTRCDETAQYGTLLTCAIEAGLGVAYTTHGDAVGLAPRGGDNLLLARAVTTGTWPQPAAPAAPAGTAAASTTATGARAIARTGARAG